MDHEPVASPVNPHGPAGRVVIAIMLGGLAVGASEAGPRLSHATVQRVVDGDTIEVSDGAGARQLVRYLGIDAPELRRRGPDGHWIYDPQPYAKAAFEANRRLVEGRQVRLEYDAETRDRYGRLLAYVYVESRLINAELVELGLARVVPHPPNTRLIGLLFQRQRDAQAHRRGLWKAAATHGHRRLGRPHVRAHRRGLREAATARP